MSRHSTAQLCKMRKEGRYGTAAMCTCEMQLCFAVFFHVFTSWCVCVVPVLSSLITELDGKWCYQERLSTKLLPAKRCVCLLTLTRAIRKLFNSCCQRVRVLYLDGCKRA